MGMTRKLLLLSLFVAFAFVNSSADAGGYDSFAYEYEYNPSQNNSAAVEAASESNIEYVEEVASTAGYSDDGDFGSNPVSDETLSEQRGMLNPEQLGVALFDANAANNVTNNTVTGSNNIAQDAFGNSSGVVSLIQNTGNNVIIQNATIVNLSLQQ